VPAALLVRLPGATALVVLPRVSNVPVVTAGSQRPVQVARDGPVQSQPVRRAESHVRVRVDC